MKDALGLLGFVVFIACTISLAAAATWLVVKISPAPDKKKKSEPPAESAA